MNSPSGTFDVVLILSIIKKASGRAQNIPNPKAMISVKVTSSSVLNTPTKKTIKNVENEKCTV